MSLLNDAISQQFRTWEIRGRGGKLFDQPVSLEPAFVPFPGYDLSLHPIDEGRRSTIFSRFWSGLGGPSPPPTSGKPKVEEAGAYYREPEEVNELQLYLPKTRPFPPSAFEAFFQQIFRASQPLAFELVGTVREIIPQFAASSPAITRIERALPQWFQELPAVPAEGALAHAWSESAPNFVALELGLGREFMLPLGQPVTPILPSVVSAMDGLRENELGLYQLLIEPTINAWEDHIAATLLQTDGKPVFTNRPELVPGAERKLGSAFVAVIVRIAACAEEISRCWEIARELAAPFCALAQRGSNHFIPLSNDGYDSAGREDDILRRCSRRTGMLLNVGELTSLLAFPTTSVSPRLRRDIAHSRAASEELRRPSSLCLGNNPHGGRAEPVWLTPEHRVRHLHIIGAPGKGKSTLLFNLLRQDIESGQGVALLDPHGDLVNRVLGIIPPERHEEVVLVDPADEEHVVGFNILAAHSDLERNLLASDLVSIFRRLSTSWGEQMNSVLRNAILAFLESSQGGTLLDLRRFLLDENFRREFLKTVSDPEVVFYWQQAFPQLTGNKSKGPVLTRLDEFLSRKPIRYMVSQQENRLDFADILDRGKILLVKLAQGQLGRENTQLLGSLFVSKIQQSAMSRQRMPETQRRDYWVYVDEFPSFITPSMAEILTGTRKYRVGLTLAHQDLHQLDADRDVASAVLNCGTRIVFRVSARDARELESGFAHFEANDLQNLGTGEAICQVGRSEADFNLLIPKPAPVDENEAAENRDEATSASHAKYARSRSEVEAELLRQYGSEDPQKGRPPSPSAAPLQSGVSEAAAPQEVKASEQESATALGEVQVENLSECPSPSAEHTDVQEQVKEIAEKLGFHAEKEKPVFGGAGRVDVSLTTDGLKIACEVSATRPVAGEVENVRKCLAAGYDAVITIAIERHDVVALAQGFATAFSAEEAKRSHVCQLRGIGALLKRLLRKAKRPDPETARSGGYKMKRKYANDPPDEEARRIEADIFQTFARALRGE